MNNRPYTWIIVTALIPAILLFQVPYAHATPPLCTLQISNIDTPETAKPGQNIAINTYLAVSCSGTTQFLLTRVDISETNSTTNLSQSSLGLGTDVTPRTWNIALLNSVHAPSSTGVWSLTAHAWVFASTLVVANATKSFQIQITTRLAITTTSSQNSATSASQTITNQSAQTSVPVTSPQPQTNTLPLTQIGLTGIVAVLLIASVISVKRRKQTTPVLGEKNAKTVDQSSTTHTISTGYSELDSLLSGGLPEGYSVLILTEPCDEIDLIIRKLIHSTISQSYTVFFMSRDTIKTQHLLSQYPTKFNAFNPMADKIPSSPNLFKILGVENLNDLNISLSKTMEPILRETSKRILILDVISDALLEHEGLTTRKWLNDFIVKRKDDGFTIVGIFNPNIAEKADAQAIVDLFDGVIEVFEKGFRQKARRFLIIKRMYGRKYVENEIMLDREKLYKAEDRDHAT